MSTPRWSRAVSNKSQRKTGRTAEEALESLKKMSPQNRLVTPEEVAALALLLASDEGRGINGQGINVDGGTVLSLNLVLCRFVAPAASSYTSLIGNPMILK